MSLVRYHLWISGRVQGVYFRYSTHQMAHHIGHLRGWVRNLPDGRVEVLVQGPVESVSQLVEWCHHGPDTAKVTHVEIIEEVVQEDLPAFLITG